MAKVTVIYREHDYRMEFNAKTLSQLLLTIEAPWFEPAPTTVIINGKATADVNHRLEDGDVVFLTTR